MNTVRPAARHRIAILLLAALATRLVTFGNPILYTDEEFYFAAGRALANGALPFVDIWDRKPIGLFLLYALPGALPWPFGVWLYQAMALACAGATAWAIGRLADAAGWARGGTPAGVAYLAWITIAGGQGGQSPVFYNLAMALAALLIVDRTRATLARDGLAMLLVGMAIQVKYTAALEGAYFGLWLMLAAWRRGQHPIGRGVILAAIALAPTVLAAIGYAALGALPAFVFANFASIFARGADPVAEQLRNLATSAAILLPLLAMAAAADRGGGEPVKGARALLTGWLVAALVAFALLPPWTDHYTLPVMLPAATLAAGMLARPRGRVAGIALIVVAALAGQACLMIDRQRRGTPAQFDALVAAVGHGRGCLYVYSASSMLYPATGRCAVSRYVFPSHLTRTREARAIGVDQMAELRRIFVRSPAVVVMGPPYAGERADVRAAALAMLARDYRRGGAVRLGRKDVALFRRRLPRASVAAVRFAAP